MKNSETKDFVAYEYISVNVPSDKEALYIDCYENFGWKVTNNVSSNNGLVDKEDYYINNTNLNNDKLVNIKFKRDRRITNKAKVISLQLKCENGLKELRRLEKEPTAKAGLNAMICALVGCIFVAISVFAVTASAPKIALCVINGLIGIIIWCFTYPLYKKTKMTKENENMPLIEEQYNIIYDTCESASKLLN